MTPENYVSLDLVDIFELVETKQLSPFEVFEAAYAVARESGDLALCLDEEKRWVDISDLGNASRTTRWTCPYLDAEIELLEWEAGGASCSSPGNSRSLLGKSFMVERLRGLGLYPIGSIRSFGLGFSEAIQTPVGRRPGLQRLNGNAGINCGGAARAVSSGVVPFAVSSDGLGSTRIFSSNNGIVGFKPSAKRDFLTPLHGDLVFPFSSDFGFSRSVRDVAFLYASAHKGEGRTSSTNSVFSRPYEGNESAGRLIAWSDVSPSGCSVDPKCREALAVVVKTLQESGHVLIEARPTFYWDSFVEVVHVVFCSYLASLIDQILSSTGETWLIERLSPSLQVCYLSGKKIDAQEYLLAEAECNRIANLIESFFERYHLLLTPTTVSAPLLFESCADGGRIQTGIEWIEGTICRSPFASQFNVSGHAAISLPAFWTESNLPVGVQIAAKFGAEPEMLRLAFAIEKLLPWKDRQSKH